MNEKKRKEDEAEDLMTTEDEGEDEEKKKKVMVVKHGKMLHSCQVSDSDMDSDGVPDSYPTPGQKDWGEEMDALDKCVGEK